MNYQPQCGKMLAFWQELAPELQDYLKLSCIQCGHVAFKVNEIRDLQGWFEDQLEFIYKHNRRKHGHKQKPRFAERKA